MGQTSIDRLRDYLAQLPPQSQALLMREYERAIARNEDVKVATFVLEELRKVVRGNGRRRSGRGSRIRHGWCSGSLEPFLVEGVSAGASWPDPPGLAVRRSGSGWQREGAPSNCSPRLRGRGSRR